MLLGHPIVFRKHGAGSTPRYPCPRLEEPSRHLEPARAPVKGGGNPCWSFDYTSLNGASMEGNRLRPRGSTLRPSVKNRNTTARWISSATSIGSCVTRYLLEVMDGSARHERVRRLIAIGPPNNGSALAELFCDPVIGPGITKRLTGPLSRNISTRPADVIVQACRPKSPTMQALREAGVRTRYRIPLDLCGETPPGSRSSSPAFKERPANFLPRGTGR